MSDESPRIFMNPSSDIRPTSPEGASGADDYGQSPPVNWREALMALVASRVALIQLESKEAVTGGVRRAIFIVVAGGCAFFGWTLLLAGGIAWIADAADWHWSHVALAAAIVHLLAGAILVRLAMKPSGNSAFPVTRAEFQKDREWIENFQKPSKKNG